MVLEALTITVSPAAGDDGVTVNAAFGCGLVTVTGWLVVAVAVLAVAAIGSFSYPAYHFVVLTTRTTWCR